METLTKKQIIETKKKIKITNIEICIKIYKKVYIQT